jgi:hypothetical protein
MGAAIVCRPPQGIYRRMVHKCFTCERRTPFVTRWDGAWYGVTHYCTVCLDGWADGYRLERPFRRGWKKERAAYIREMWDAAMLPDRWRAWTHWDAHRAICDEDPCVECETRPS